MQHADLLPPGTPPVLAPPAPFPDAAVPSVLSMLSNSEVLEGFLRLAKA